MADETNARLTLNTKLYRPIVPSEHVHRPRLLKQLGLWRERPLTLVSAPAGYGKSVLVSCWLKTCDMHSGWVSLDGNDNDLRVFMTYFITAIERLFPESCGKTHAMISGPELPSMEELFSNLLNELDQIAQPCIVVLDDYHLIKENMIHNFLTELLKHPPQSLHLVIIARHDPLLPIYSLRAKRLVTEIRSNDLRFSNSETAELLEMVLGKQVDSSIAATLTEMTEGWITGLCLAAISLRLTGNTKLSLLKQHIDTQLITEYFFNEILANQPPQISKYLMFSATLDRFCASLCEAVCDQETETLACELSGWEYIGWLKRENMFLIPLDVENHWFRFHHLFRKLLLNQLKRHYKTDDINVLHARASAWFADNGLIEEAIRHAMVAGDASGAVQLVVQNRQAALDTQNWFKLEKWLSILPDDNIQQQPELLLTQAWIHYFHYDYGLIPAVSERAESLLSNHSHRQLLSGEVNLFKGITSYFQGDGARCLKYIEDAMEQILAAHQYQLAIADVFWGLAGQMQGQKERIVTKLTEMLRNQPLGDARKSRVMTVLAFVFIISGDLATAFSLIHQLKSFAISINSDAIIIWSSYLLGLIHFCRNEMDKAIDHLSKACEIGYVVLRRLEVDCLGVLALAYQTIKQPDQTAASMKRLNKYVLSIGSSEFLETAHSFAARLSLMKGEEPMPSGLSSIKKPSNAYPMFLWMELPDISQCRVLLAAGTDSDLQEAENRLKECLRLSHAQNNTFHRIYILPLLASAYEKQERIEEALTVLEEAVNLAAPGKFIRPFIESGPTTAALLTRLAEKGIAEDYIGRLLDAFSPPTRQPSSVVQTPDVQLTNREHEILELIARRLRTKEIAEKLFISTHTVNAHLKNLYRKVDAHDRRQAVARAKKLGIL
jgi:ATP/maltotriose-dependent transcriptional regulator MalT